MNLDRLSLSALLVSLSDTLDEQSDLLRAQQEVLDLDLDVISQADRELRHQDFIIGEQRNALDQIVRAIEDLGLSKLIAQRVSFNLTLDLLGIDHEMFGAPTLRSGDDLGDFAFCG